MKTNSKDKEQDRNELTFNSETESIEGEEKPEEGEIFSKEESVENELEKSKRIYGELNDKYLRLAADFENYKKRISKEKADLVTYGNEELIKSLLSILDNLERAIEHTESNKESESIIEGIKLVQKQFIDCLEKFGVKMIEVNTGDEFDPNLHQAVERVESNEIGPGLIISEVLKGYTLRDRLMRPALVTVSKEEAQQALGDESTDSMITQKKEEGDGKDESVFIETDSEKK